MKVSKLREVDIALFSRKIMDAGEYEALSALEKQECKDALTAAKAVAAQYTGLDMKTTECEDITYAVKVLAAEMLDNHQITAQYTGRNPTVMQILDLHSTNLLPGGVG